MTPRVVLVVAALTLREFVRRRIVWVLLVLAVASVLLVGWGVERLVSLAREDGAPELEIRIGVSQVLILIAFMFSFVLAMTAAFVGAPAVGGDLESGVAYAILARPLRRAELIIGRWLGSAVVVVAYTIASGLLAIGVAVLVSGYGPPDPVLAIAFLSGEVLVLLTLTLALGSVMPAIAAGAIAVVGFGLGWMAGVMAGVAAALGVEGLRSIAEASRWILPTDGLWRGVIYGLEPPLVVLIAAGRAPALANANPFYATEPPALAFVIWSIVWMGLVLGAATWWFERRDL
jgi:ABC-type transport system involved in multi-copper enzyme maturation permease subunit